ncbi:MAG: DUF4465 domain-containing protein [Flavobacteriales bacterium]
MKIKKLLFALFGAVSMVNYAQETTTQGVFVGNSGNGPQTNVSYLDLASQTTTFQADVQPSYVQYILNENNFAYLAATDSIFKYNLATLELEASSNFHPTSTNNLLISGEYLFVGNQFGTDDAHLQVYDKNTLDSTNLLSFINYPVTDMVEVGGKLYVLQNIKHTVETFPNYYVDSLGFISVVNLADFSLETEITFDASQAHNFKKVFAHNNKLTIFGTHEFGTVSHNVYTYDIATETKTYNTFPHSINLTYGNQSAQKEEKVYFKFNGGIGLYDLAGDSVLNASVVSKTPTSFAVDWNAEKIYHAKGNYFSIGAGEIYDFAGDSIGTFSVGNGYAPEAIAVVESYNPIANADYGRVKMFGENVSGFNFLSGQTPTVDVSVVGNDQFFTSVEIIGQGTSGTSTISADGLLTYSPTDYTDGTITDEIEYRIANAFNNYDTAKVTVDWIEVNASTISFDELTLPADGFANGSDLKGGFLSSEYSEDNRGAYFPTNYNPAWGSWNGFSASNLLDNTTAGFGNQYSTYVGAASNGDQFAVAHGEVTTFEISSHVGVKSLMISNATYTALSMKDGDAFAKKFGGADGTDEDWFKVMVYGIDYSDHVVDSVEVYLADYRFANSTDDYILDNWKLVDFAGTQISQTPIKSIQFKLSSSDVGNWGMNTPSYFCLDDIQTGNNVSVQDYDNNASVSLYPNPTTNTLMVNHLSEGSNQIRMYNMQGALVLATTSANQSEVLDLTHLSSGVYIVEIENAIKTERIKITKL